MKDMLNKILEKYPEESFLIADGFNEAVIGVDVTTQRLIYSYKKCIEILMRDMDEEESVEYFNFNVEGAYMGEKTPIWHYDNF